MNQDPAFQAAYKKALNAIEAINVTTPHGASEPNYDYRFTADGLPYRVRIIKNQHGPGYQAQLIGEGSGTIMEPADESRIGSVHRLIKELKITGDPHDAKMAKAIDLELEAALEAWNTFRTKPIEHQKQITIKAIPAGFKFKEPFATMFRKGGTGGDQLKIAVLGDKAYVYRFKMPKWNIKPSVLDTPDVAIRHYNELGISTSKGANRQRSQYFHDLQKKFNDEHLKFFDLALKTYGRGTGSMISGGFYEHWPAQIKDRLRFLAHGSQVLSDAGRLHDALSKTRSPAFK